MILNAVVFYTVVIYYAHCLVGSLLFHFPNLIPFWRFWVKLKNVVVVNIAALVLVLASCKDFIFSYNSCCKWLGVSVVCPPVTMILLPSVAPCSSVLGEGRGAENSHWAAPSTSTSVLSRAS